MLYERILVPFDGSKFAKKALDEAIKIAQNTDSVLYLCTVVTVSNMIPPGSLIGLVKNTTAKELHSKLIRSAKAEADRTLSYQTSVYCKSKGVKAYYKIVINGNISEEILKTAKQKLVDLIVIGSQGLHGISKIKTLGSVSRKVSELADCAVLIVR
ncbi:MAG TPA: universal stress protein [Candidatus Nitrosotenuis sp.]|jgi:nucleotide-binding universal stress UspA family protein